MIAIKEPLMTSVTGRSAACVSSTHVLRLRDGAELFYRAWLPETPARKALILFHRGHEHSGRWQETVANLGLDDVAVFAWDARGHGQSSGERGAAPSLATVVKDADEFVRYLSEQHDIRIEDMAVLAHSVGAVIAAAWVHDFAPPLRGLVLATPAFRVKLYVPFAVPLLRLRQKLFGPGQVKSYVKASLLTRDRAQAEEYRRDPLIFPQIAVNMLLDLHDTSTRLLADAGAITVPTLVLTAGRDWVVRNSAARQFVAGLSAPVKRLEHLPGFGHAIFHERGRGSVVEKVRDFLRECFESMRPPVSLVHADRSGYTKDEYERLCRSGSLRFALVRAGMRTVGRLSKGIRLGWQTGFDSGRTLDHVYTNRPQGMTPLGRFIDRQYLNSIGWRGIRLRREHLEQLLRQTIERLHVEKQRIHILDIASGPGRYILETVSRCRHLPITALLRDYKQDNLEAAAALAQQLGVSGITFMQGDAFDREGLAALRPRPTLAVVSGLYELFPENAPVQRSLAGVADALEPGGYLIYTNQPWHPQVEFIARVLTNREGKPWIMRRRTQAEMDELVRRAGFDKLEQEVDPWGIFTVSLARKRG